MRACSIRWNYRKDLIGQAIALRLDPQFPEAYQARHTLAALVY